METCTALVSVGVTQIKRRGLTIRSTGPIAAGRHLGYKSLAQIPAGRNRPVSSNVRPHKQHWGHSTDQKHLELFQDRSLYTHPLNLGKNINMRQLTLITVAVTVTLLGCANRPESIRASYVPIEKFENLDCNQFTTALANAQGGLSDSSRRQNDKANADAVGVFLLGVPFSKLSGDHEGEIAQQKGEIEAIQGALAERGCNRMPSSSLSPSLSLANSAQEAQQRLEILDSMKTRGLVTLDEYQARRSRIIDEALDSRSSRADTDNKATDESTQVVTMRDLEPYSGAHVSELVLRLTETKSDRYEFNSGGLTLARGTVSVLRGALPAPSLIGFRVSQLTPGSTIRARLTSSMSAGFDTPAEITGYVKQSNLGSGLIRVDIDGYAPRDVISGTSNSARGARITGSLEVDLATGLSVAGNLRSANSGFLLRRELVGIERARRNN